MNAISRHWSIIRSSIADEKARAKRRAPVEEPTFLPAALEIVERPVSPTGRITAWLLLGGLLLTLLWLTLGRIDVVASAQGRLIPAGNVKLVQPAEAGIVRRILVREGQRVRAGQTLVELDPTVSTAEAIQAERALETAALDSARARAVLGALDGGALVFTPPPGTTAAVAAAQRALARAQLADILARSATHGAERRGAMAAMAEARIEAAKLTETLPLLDEQIAANEQLLARGFVSRLKVIEMRRQRLAAARDRDIALETAGRAAAQVAAAGGGLAQSDAQARAQLLAEVTRAEAEMLLRREELTKARQRSSLQRLVSPIDGIVSRLSIHTVGGVVEAAKPIMAIVPSGGPLQVEVRLLNRDVGFVREGQPVSVKLEAFPFTRHGTIPGRVERIGSDAVEDERLGLVYTAWVTLDRDFVDLEGRRSALVPGMAATADIRTGRRSILSYLVSPLNEARLEAGRER